MGTKTSSQLPVRTAHACVHITATVSDNPKS